MKKFFFRCLLFALCHVVIVAVASFISASMTSRAFEDGSDVPMLADMFGGFARLLMTPFRLFWTSGLSQKLPDLVEWILFGVNSLFWGYMIAFLLSRTRLRRRETV